MVVPPRARLGWLAVLVAISLSPCGAVDAADDGYWELVESKLDEPPKREEPGVKVYPSTRSGAFVLRAAYNDRSGKHIDDWTIAFRWNKMPRTYAAGGTVALEITRTVTHQPKKDVGHRRCSVGARMDRPVDGGWAPGAGIPAADDRDGLFVMSRWPEQPPRTSHPVGKAPAGGKGDKFCVAVVIYHGVQPPWIWRYIYAWRGGSAPRDPGPAIEPARAWKRGQPSREDPVRPDQPTRPAQTRPDSPDPTRTQDRTSRFTLKADRRQVKVGGTVAVPIWLLGRGDLGNLNFEVAYDASVVRPTGKAIKGNLLGRALFESNAAPRGRMKIGFAARGPVSGDGTIAQIRWQAVGRAGARSPLTLTVTRADRSSGGAVRVGVIHGEILLLNAQDRVPNDVNNNKVVDAGDALEALKMSVDLIPEDLICDADKDGTVTSNDARLILKQALERD